MLLFLLKENNGIHFLGILPLLEMGICSLCIVLQIVKTVVCCSRDWRLKG